MYVSDPLRTFLQTVGPGLTRNVQRELAQLLGGFTTTPGLLVKSHVFDVALGIGDYPNVAGV